MGLDVAIHDTQQWFELSLGQDVHCAAWEKDSLIATDFSSISGVAGNTTRTRTGFLVW
jgi:hypothetical protein